jgi:hypothetical protein
MRLTPLRHHRAERFDSRLFCVMLPLRMKPGSVDIGSAARLPDGFSPNMDPSRRKPFFLRGAFSALHWLPVRKQKNDKNQKSRIPPQ